VHAWWLPCQIHLIVHVICQAFSKAGTGHAPSSTVQAQLRACKHPNASKSSLSHLSGVHDPAVHATWLPCQIHSTSCPPHVRGLKLAQASPQQQNNPSFRPANIPDVLYPWPMPEPILHGQMYSEVFASSFLVHLIGCNHCAGYPVSISVHPQLPALIFSPGQLQML